MLRAIAALLEEQQQPARYALMFFNTKEKSQMGEITVQDTETALEFAVSTLDEKGFPAQPETTPTYTSTEPGVADIVAAADGLSGTVTVGEPGDAVFTGTGFGTDDNGAEIVAKGTVHVTAGPVRTVSMDFKIGPSA